MLDKIQIVKPAEIEKRSMEIITSELNGRTWPEPEFSIVKRCIHTSADFDYADNLCFSENAANIGVEALKNGAHIVTDTRMAWSGINKKKLASFGGEAHCFMSDDDVAKEAKERGCTRAAICMERGAVLAEEKNIIFAIGNAPTALIRLYELIKRRQVKTSIDYRRTSWLCQCSRIQRTDYGSRSSFHRSKRTKRRQQHCGNDL